MVVHFLPLLLSDINEQFCDAAGHVKDTILFRAPRIISKCLDRVLKKESPGKMMLNAHEQAKLTKNSSALK